MPLYLQALCVTLGAAALIGSAVAGAYLAWRVVVATRDEPKPDALLFDRQSELEKEVLKLRGEWDVQLSEMERLDASMRRKQQSLAGQQRQIQRRDELQGEQPDEEDPAYWQAKFDQQRRPH